MRNYYVLFRNNVPPLLSLDWAEHLSGYLTEKPSAKAIPIDKSLENQPHNSQVVKEYNFANAENKQSILKRKLT